jgi:hypothetical protein
VSSWEGGTRGAEWRRQTGRVIDEDSCSAGKGKGKVERNRG